jgi:hypothetical protein
MCFLIGNPDFFAFDTVMARVPDILVVTFLDEALFMVTVDPPTELVEVAGDKDDFVAGWNPNTLVVSGFPDAYFPPLPVSCGLVDNTNRLTADDDARKVVMSCYHARCPMVSGLGADVKAEERIGCGRGGNGENESDCYDYFLHGSCPPLPLVSVSGYWTRAVQQLFTFCEHRRREMGRIIC